MLESIFPRTIDNNFRGHVAALWLFGIYVALRIVINTNLIFNTRSVAVGGDAIPIDTMSTNAAATVLMVMAVQAVGQLVLALLGLLVLLRYRAMVPLITVLVLGELIARRLYLLAHPIERIETMSVGTYLNYAFFALLLAILALSLLGRTSRGAGRTSDVPPTA